MLLIRVNSGVNSGGTELGNNFDLNRKIKQKNKIFNLNLFSLIHF